jgi:TRAP-type C4-dicarboxylate transport system substrate-binding protein
MSTEQTPRFRYRLGLNQPAASPTVKRITEMAQAIGEETDGEFLVEVFPESRLGPDPRMFADLRSGALEFFMAGATLGEVAPTSALPLLPFAFRDSKAVFAAVDGALGDQIRSELALHGIHAFRHCLQNGFHHLTTSTRPINTAADLAGLKIRSPGGAIARDFFEAFGASEPHCPLVVGFHAAGQRWCVASAAATNSTGRRGQCREIRAATARRHRAGQCHRRRRTCQQGDAGQHGR